MTKPCIVPQCKTGSRSVKTKLSVFKVPSNSERLKKWQSAIPKKVLTSSHYVCERHFEDQCILRKYIKHDADGKVIAEVLYKHPRLKESAIPTIFDEAMDIDAVTNSNDAPLDVHMKETAVVQSSSSGNEKLSIHTTDIPMTNTPETVWAHYSSSSDDIGIHATQVEMINGPSNVSFPSHQVVADMKLDISPVAISRNASSAHLDDGADCVASLPVPWVAGQLSSSPDQSLVFLYPEIIKKRGIGIPITAKTVTVDKEKNVRYFVHGNLVDDDEVNLRGKLDSLTDLPNILIKFADFKMCCGIGEVNINFLPAEESFKDYTDGWHHKKCSLLSKKRRCENCCKLRKRVLQKVKRTESLYPLNRISRLSNPVDNQKLKIIKKRMKCERRGRNRAKSRLSILRNSFKTQQLEIAV